jgi:hypothetical protein
MAALGGLALLILGALAKARPWRMSATGAMSVAGGREA